jgi:uncharacterized protein (DUF1501 family)
MFLIGERVRAGFYGEPPDLAHLEDGNLPYGIDFRSVYATVLEDWLEASAADILGDSFDKLNLIEA